MSAELVLLARYVYTYREFDSIFLCCDVAHSSKNNLQNIERDTLAKNKDNKAHQR